MQSYSLARNHSSHHRQGSKEVSTYPQQSRHRKEEGKEPLYNYVESYNSNPVALFQQSAKSGIQLKILKLITAGKVETGQGKTYEQPL